MKNQINQAVSPRDESVDSNPKLSKNQIALHYIHNGYPHRNPHTPRKGFYWITEIIDVQFSPRIEVWLKALYHPTEQDFEQQFGVDCQFSSLLNAGSEGPKEAIHSLLGAIIQISEAKVEEYEYRGEPQKRYLVIWKIVGYEDPKTESSIEPVNLNNPPTLPDKPDLIQDFLNQSESEALLEESALVQAEIEMLLDQWENENYGIAFIVDNFGRFERISEAEAEILLDTWEEEHREVPEALEDLKPKSKIK